MNGSEYTPVTKNITLGCISKDARELLENIMEEWAVYLVQLRKVYGKNYEPGVYGFAYWLCRYSGLIEGVKLPQESTVNRCSLYDECPATNKGHVGCYSTAVCFMD